MRHFASFPELMQWRQTCPSCNGPLTYEIKTAKSFRTGNLMKRLEAYFTSALKDDNEEIKVCFKPEFSTSVTVEDMDLTIKFDENKCLASNLESASTLFSLNMYCNHDVLGRVYNAMGSFEFDIDFQDYNLIPKQDDKLCLNIENVFIKYEQFTVCNLHLDADKPSGNLIKIIHDYSIEKTSFSMAEVSLDGTFGTWKEKRVDLVDDSFFKFSNSEKVFSRINTIFLLADK